MTLHHCPLRLLLLPIIGTLLLAAACNRTSPIGESLKPESDRVSARVDSLPISVRTIAADSVYSRSVYTLLGELIDPAYGDFKASYATRIQNAPGFTFTHTPVGGKVDSVYLSIAYESTVGDSLAWSKVSVYELQKRLPQSHYSGNLSDYTADAVYLGSTTYQPADTAGVHTIFVRIPNEIGDRILTASREHPEYFQTQEALESNLLKGFFVQTTSGTGSVVSVYATDLDIYYSYRYEGTAESGNDTVYNKPALETFSNSAALSNHNDFRHSGLSALLSTPLPYTYIKAPAGALTEVSVSADELTRLYRNIHSARTDSEATPQGFATMINSASLAVGVNLPDVSSRLNPPMYLMLCPKDSVNSFFEQQRTDLLSAEKAFLSSSYNIISRSYDFANIARLIDAHLQAHAVVGEGGAVTIAEPLVLYLVPVQRTVRSNSGAVATVVNYLYPAAVRLYFPPEKLYLQVSSTGYVNQ